MTNSKNNRFHDAKSGSAITVSLHLNAKVNKVEKVLPDGTLQIGLVNPKEDPAVDADLIKFLSNLFDVPSNRFEIISGKNTSHKLISIIGVSVDQVQQIIGRLVKIPS
ncbi:uncharacterized conserved protein [Bellilinea caldifistulae]|uniref:Uncharacterized protein n=1 Tax=Bellilinea caldifistulae TaxID=360411 RepID=A0A0P6WPS6_9CHLR|nr:DUF167 family protein [Bellilinea caldifistulae]KPL70780.1 hypothetical protein AC812_16685 [Bellilinea caldifistulae]GAP10898.1 uncharacterized conserved protein [Bellilinea caldifistulae]